MESAWNIGIISDTHDNMENLDKALKLFKNNKVKTILHLGDYISSFVIDRISDANINMVGIFGENDGDPLSLLKSCNQMMEIYSGPYVININNRKFLLTREVTTIEDVAKSNKYDFILFGTTHKYYSEKIRNTYILNPGETFGRIKSEASVIILNLDQNKHEKYVL